MSSVDVTEEGEGRGKCSDRPTHSSWPHANNPFREPQISHIGHFQRKKGTRRLSGFPFVIASAPPEISPKISPGHTPSRDSAPGDDPLRSFHLAGEQIGGDLLPP